MSDGKPRKRAESLAVENVKRIADVLRTERNDALAMAQMKRQEADQLRGHLIKAQSIISAAAPFLNDETAEAAKSFLEDMEDSLKAAK